MAGDILIYQDYIQNHGLLYKKLIEIYGRERVGFCDSADICAGCLRTKPPQLFVMPGGADLYYCEKLNGKGNQEIRHYVENGGSYLGICAGAYYAAKNIIWAADTKHEIAGDRELQFFNGQAIGPVKEFMETGEIEQSWSGITRLTFTSEKHSDAHVRYTGGPVFIPEDTNKIAILAYYADLPNMPPAIIKCTVGRGKVMLSSPHIESTPKEWQSTIYTLYNPSAEYERTLPASSSKEEKCVLSLLLEEL